jgi:ABC-2 type transport system permease protein
VQIAQQLPAVWPASFLPRVLDQDLALEPWAVEFSEARLDQARCVARWSWLSPGLALVLLGERLAGTDVASHVRYLQHVDAFEQRWRDFLIPRVMDREGLRPQQLEQLPRFAPRAF